MTRFLGYFCLFEIGVFACLDGFLVTTFSGLRQHGGSPPRAPAGENASPWAYRLALILYPSRGAFDNLANVALAAMGTPHLVRVRLCVVALVPG